MSLEIERKFLLSKYPQSLFETGELQPISEQFIDQTYVAISTDEELRVRKIINAADDAHTYTHTFKQGTGLVRKEIEYEISEELYYQLIHQLQLKPLCKKRITARWTVNNIIVEIDIYEDLSFIVLEVEFDSEQEANSFNPPEWFGTDISFNREYGNKSVWKKLNDIS